jgi:exosortase
VANDKRVQLMRGSDSPQASGPPSAFSRLSGLHLSNDPETNKRLILAGIGFLLVFYAYFVSKTCEQRAVPVSVFGWLAGYWFTGEDYAHGPFAPLVSLGLGIWIWKKKLRSVPMRTSWVGLGTVVLAVLIYWVGAKAANPRLLAGSLVVLVFGLVLYLAGWRWARALWFPCAFLLFMIPVNFLDERLAFPLRMFATTLSTGFLNLFGMDVYQNGTSIISRLGRFQPLGVEDPCSGIRSMVALMALTSLYGFVTMDKTWKKWLLFFSSIPLAVLGNLARITTIAFVAQGFGQDLAMRIYHDYSGYIFFSLAILCMIGLGASLNVHYRELIHRWTREEVPLPVPPRRTAK